MQDKVTDRNRRRDPGNPLMPRVTPNLRCRFYEEKYPDKEEVVVARVREIAEMGAYAKLLEYNEIEGMILMSELSRRRIRSVNKLVRIGRDEYVVVLRADTEKGYIDLSKRRATTEDHTAADNRYKKQKTVHSIIKNAATNLNLQSDEELESLMNRSVWHFDRTYKKVNETAKASYNYFKKAVEDPSVFDECDLNEEEKSAILKNIHNRMMPAPDKIRADISVSCTGPDGIEAVKAALKHGINVTNVALKEANIVEIKEKTHDQKTASDNENENESTTPTLKIRDHGQAVNVINMTLIAPPEYVITFHTLDKELGIKFVQICLKAIEEKIKCYAHGSFKIKDQARVVGKQEDDQLKETMAQAEAANKQVAGDDDEEDM